MDRRGAGEINLEDVDARDQPAMVHVDIAGYASFNPTGHQQERFDDDQPSDAAQPMFR